MSNEPNLKYILHTLSMDEIAVVFYVGKYVFYSASTSNKTDSSVEFEPIVGNTNFPHGLKVQLDGVPVEVEIEVARNLWKFLKTYGFVQSPNTAVTYGPFR